MNSNERLRKAKGRPAWMNMRRFGCLIVALLVVAALTIPYVLLLFNVPGITVDRVEQKEGVSAAVSILNSNTVSNSQDVVTVSPTQPDSFTGPDTQEGEQLSTTNIESQPENQLQANETEPDALVTVEACIASPDDFAWEFFDLSREQGSSGTRCLGNLRLQSRYDDRLLVYKFLERSAGSSGDQTNAWSRGLILEAGAVDENSISYTAYDNDEVTFKLFTKIFVMYETNACRLLLDLVSEATYDQYAVAIENPCLE